MLTLSPTPELEHRLEEEAAMRGLRAPEYALRLIEGLLRPKKTGDAAEQARQEAIDELLGIAANSSFSTTVLRHERDGERALEEDRYRRRFGAARVGRGTRRLFLEADA